MNRKVTQFMRLESPRERLIRLIVTTHKHYINSPRKLQSLNFITIPVDTNFSNVTTRNLT